MIHSKSMLASFHILADWESNCFEKLLDTVDFLIEALQYDEPIIELADVGFLYGTLKYLIFKIYLLPLPTYYENLPCQYKPESKQIYISPLQHLRAPRANTHEFRHLHSEKTFSFKNIHTPAFLSSHLVPSLCIHTVLFSCYTERVLCTTKLY